MGLEYTIVDTRLRKCAEALITLLKVGKETGIRKTDAIKHDIPTIGIRHS